MSPSTSLGVATSIIMASSSTSAATGGGGNPPRPQQLVLPPSLQILADSWTITAQGYDNIFVPKFAPWTKDTLQALKDEIETMMENEKEEETTTTAATTTEGIHHRCCWVPCCGPGEEIAMLSDILIESSSSTNNSLSCSILGTDLAPGMVQLARRRLGMDVHQVETTATGGKIVIETSESDGPTNENSKKKIASIVIDVRVGNAMEVPDPIPPSRKFSAILCIFGLQQLPNPVDAIRSWVQALDDNNGGVLVVCYWPQGKSQKVPDEPPDPLNPWSRLREVVQKSMAAEVTKGESTSRDVAANTNKGGNDNLDADPPIVKEQGIMDYWEDELVPVALSIHGTQIVRDCTLSHEIQWQTAVECFDAMTNAGPLHALRLRMGDQFVDSMRDEFCSAYPPDQSMAHTFKARLLVIRRS